MSDMQYPSMAQDNEYLSLPLNRLHAGYLVLLAKGPLASAGCWALPLLLQLLGEELMPVQDGLLQKRKCLAPPAPFCTQWCLNK